MSVLILIFGIGAIPVVILGVASVIAIDRAAHELEDA